MAPAAVNFLRNAVSQKMPRFLYHLTTKRNYRAIMKDGFLRPHNDALFGEGVCTVDLMNCFKRWQELSCNDKNYVSYLLNQVSKKKDKIVIFRIPTTKLKYDKLAIRSQNRLHDFMYTDFVYDEAIPQSRALGNLFQKGMGRAEEQELSNTFLKEILKEHNIPNVDHCIHGAPANQAAKYKHRKEAIEYIYKDSIPASDIEKIGEVDLMWSMLSRKYHEETPIKSIFDIMLKGTPEANATKLLHC